MQQGVMSQGRWPNRRLYNPLSHPLNVYKREYDDFDDDVSNATFRIDRDPRLTRSRHRQLLYKVREVVDHNTGSIKLPIPPFLGKNDPYIYICWVGKKGGTYIWLSLLFKTKKVKLAAVTLTDYVCLVGSIGS